MERSLSSIVVFEQWSNACVDYNKASLYLTGTFKLATMAD
jgi:hypothetical protein